MLTAVIVLNVLVKAFPVGATDVTTVVPVGEEHCRIDIPGQCTDVDAIVFVHGIYGGDDTFKNPTSKFDWPSEMPRVINGHKVDVYKLIYRTELIAWARGANPTFEVLTESTFAAMKPLRTAGYRSIGFIAHSLGGNVISTYIHKVKTAIGHPQRSQNAFVVTLATPVLGAQIADLASILKSTLGMTDPLLASLKSSNLFLTMLQQFREDEQEKGQRYACRPVHLHAAIEKKYLGPILIVRPESAVRPISDFANSPIVAFELNHEMIAKPVDAQSAVYRWVMGRVLQEYQRISDWDEAHKDAPVTRHLCELMDYLAEKP
jgi:hypothetical protein